ncbi:MAG: SpoVG family protein [Planctomycetota bacterium]|jgi:stage V sporulation protein G
MDITDVRVKPISDSSERLKAVCTVTFDGSFVVRDVKIVDGANGLFVAMPSRKMSASCPDCNHKNAIRAKYCSECGLRLPHQQISTQDEEGRSKLHRDVAHPITSEFRAVIQEKVIQAYEAEFSERRDDAPQEDAPAESKDKSSDDYSDMIAGLKGGRRRGSEKRGGRREGSSGDSGSGGAESGRGRSGRGRSRGPGGRGRDRDRDRDRSSKPREEVPVASDDDTEEPAVAPAKPNEESFEEETTTAVATADQVSIEKNMDAPSPADGEDIKEDTDPFGLGLV